ncbi:hypothetical protein [Arthrobacter castelli]|uniref:hypothetical protein n=1 Tax=Arthrobacter castelli TaxID=271431 RepID=UPI00041B8443|nr:hypothetical protein [Arthrobacter castelli]
MAAVPVLVLGLAACGGGADGEYIGESESATAAGYSTLIIDGDTMTYQTFRCGKEPYAGERNTSVGQLNDDQTHVIWTQEGQWEGDNQISMTEDSLSMSGVTFTRKGTDAAQAQLKEHRETCSDSD